MLPVSASKTVSLPSGDKLELFYISKLAEALGRTPQTVRRWEIAKIIPPTIFKDRFGKRLYSQEQIDVLVRVAEECGIVAGKAFSHTSFVKDATEAFNVLHRKYVPQKPSTGTQDRRKSR